MTAPFMHYLILRGTHQATLIMKKIKIITKGITNWGLIIIIITILTINYIIITITTISFFIYCHPLKFISLLIDYSIEKNYFYNKRLPAFIISEFQTGHSRAIHKQVIIF